MTSAASLPPGVLQLAQTVDIAPGELSFLAGLPAADLTALRHQIADTLFRADRHMFARIAALANAVPIPIAAKLCENLLTPLLTARTAEVLDPTRAAEVVSRMSDRYVADVSAALDPARAPEVIALIPPAKIAALAAELARRGEWVVMAGFVSHVSEAAVVSSVAGFDGEQLLRVVFLVDDHDRLDTVVGNLRDDQLDDLLAAAPERGMWREFCSLLDRVQPTRLTPLGHRFRSAPAQVRVGFDAALDAGALTPEHLERLSS